MPTYFIQQRMHEITFRKIFGSNNRQILYRLIKTLPWHVIVAFVIATPVIGSIMRGCPVNRKVRISQPSFPPITSVIRSDHPSDRVRSAGWRDQITQVIGRVDGHRWKNTRGKEKITLEMNKSIPKTSSILFILVRFFTQHHTYDMSQDFLPNLREKLASGPSPISRNNAFLSKFICNTVAFKRYII